MKPLVACIGTTDPWNAAGLGLDVRVLDACGARASSVVAGVSAQDRAGLHAARAVDPTLIAAQFASLRGAPIAAFRIGALLDVPSVEVVAAAVSGHRVPVVLDPVLAASSGGRFAGEAVVRAIARDLLPHVTLVTPNGAEAAQLLAALGIADAGDVARCNAASRERAARALVAAGARAALVTGGDCAPDVLDVLVADGGTSIFEERRIEGGMRGTGCVLAGAIAAALATGTPLRDAVARGRAFVRARIAAAVDLGGMRVMA